MGGLNNRVGWKFAGYLISRKGEGSWLTGDGKSCFCSKCLETNINKQKENMTLKN